MAEVRMNSETEVCGYLERPTEGESRLNATRKCLTSSFCSCRPRLNQRKVGESYTELSGESNARCEMLHAIASANVGHYISEI